MTFPDMFASDGSPGRVSWDFRRGPAAARILVELGSDYGVGAATALRRTGLTEAALHDPQTLVEAAAELTIARNLLRAAGNAPGLGAQAGKRYTIGTLGVWGFALMTCPTVRDLLRLGTHYAALSFAFIRPVLEAAPREARVRLDDVEIPEDVRVFFVQREIAKLATLLPVVLDDIRGFRFETSLKGREGEALKSALPGAQVVVGCVEHAVVAPESRLGDPLPQADPDASSLVEQQLRELIERRRRAGPVAGRVRAALLTRPKEMSDMQRIASELGMDERTLRRRLVHERTSFRELAHEVRETLATELLTEGGLTIQETAERLGYHDAGSFSRAYKRWTGVRPGDARRAAA